MIKTGTGAEVFAKSLAQGLAKRGYKIDFDLIPHRYQYFPWLASPRARAGTDVIIANSWTAAAFAGAAPLITVVHHVVHDPAMAPHKTVLQSLFHRCFVLPMERAALSRSAATVAVSQTTADSIRRYLTDVAVHTILNGVDTNFFSPARSPAEHDPDRPIKLLFVGKPSRRKGIEIVARIVDCLGDKCHLTMIGPKPEAGVQLPDGAVLGRVSRETLRAAYQDADFLLFPSRLEGFGYVAAEAMACGLPVICSEGGAVAEVVAPPKAGISIADDKGADALAEPILALWRDPERLAAMRKSARERASLDFNEELWLDNFVNLLNEVSERRP